MAKFYSNENFPRRAVEALRSLGHDVLTSFEAGRANQRIPDDQVLAFAAAEGRAVLTLNRRDFVELHAANPKHAGIVVTTYMADAEAWAARIEQAIPESDAVLAGCLIRVLKPSADSGKFTGCIQGGVLLLGSLYWEDLKGRKEWRDERLTMDQQTKVSDLPMCYGRLSGTRGEYTMTLVPTKSGGTAVLAPLKRRLAVVDGHLTARAAGAFRIEVEKLAKVEGIHKPRNARHLGTGSPPWGCVALWAPDSGRTKPICWFWNRNLSFRTMLNAADSAAMQKRYLKLCDEHGRIALPWPATVPTGIDFILCTPTLPDDPLPTPPQIAASAGPYFENTTASGIITADDAEIQKLRRQKA